MFYKIRQRRNAIVVVKKVDKISYRNSRFPKNLYHSYRLAFHTDVELHILRGYKNSAARVAGTGRREEDYAFFETKGRNSN